MIVIQVVPISVGTHFNLFLFIRIKNKKFLLMQIDSFYSENRTEEMSSLKNGFHLMIELRRKNWNLSYFIHTSMRFNQILLVVLVMFVCLHFFGNFPPPIS